MNGIDFYLRKHENGTREMTRKELDETAIRYVCFSGRMHSCSQIDLERAS